MNNQIINAPGVAELAKYGVNVKNVTQVISQPLYDYQTYGNAGATAFTFFQQPIGQNGRTEEDTNMDAAGQLPAGKQMLVMGIEVVFNSGAASTSLSAAAPTDLQVADLNAIQNRGHVQLYVGSKAQYDDSGLQNFPTGVGIQTVGALADSSTAGASQVSVINQARFGGRATRITPLVLPSNQNFRVTIEFPNGVVAMPSGVDATIGVRLLGYQYRTAQ